MKIIKKISNMQHMSLELRKHDEILGFVPTMGYLHDGHLGLVRLARQECTKVIISIFVNPAQFGPGEDFDKYPRDLKRDLSLARNEGVDLIFSPEKDDMYGRDFATRVSVKDLNRIMCGHSRPIHFDGVCTVVLKLFNIVQPHFAYFGEKDYQQLVIIRKMVSDLDIPVRIVGCPTVREIDGLAMSSRNKYLTSGQRKDAAVLYRCLKSAAESIRNGETDLMKIKKDVLDMLKNNRSVEKVDYFEFRDAEDLSEIVYLNKHLTEKPDGNILIASAIWIGNTRLIDNIIYKAGAGL